MQVGTAIQEFVSDDFQYHQSYLEEEVEEGGGRMRIMKKMILNY